MFLRYLPPLFCNPKHSKVISPNIFFFPRIAEPFFIKVWYSIGVSLYNSGRTKEAIKAYDKSTRIKLCDNKAEDSSD